MRLEAQSSISIIPKNVSVTLLTFAALKLWEIEEYKGSGKIARRASSKIVKSCKMKLTL